MFLKMFLILTKLEMTFSFPGWHRFLSLYLKIFSPFGQISRVFLSVRQDFCLLALGFKGLSILNIVLFISRVIDRQVIFKDHTVQKSFGNLVKVY